MCQLCSDNEQERETARRACISNAERLERMANMERQLASGKRKPHSGDGAVNALARGLIRYLVEEWM